MPNKHQPLRLAIDGNEANCASRVGSNAYAYYLLTNMVKAAKTLHRDFVLTIFLDHEPLPDMPQESAKVSYKIVRPQKLWTQLGLPAHLFLNCAQYDLFFTPGHYAPRCCPIPYVSSVMDLAFLRYSELFRKRDLFKLESWTRYSVHHASKVVAISNFTKEEICYFYDKNSADIIVAPPGLGDNLPKLTPTQTANILRSLGINQPFFLYLGTLQPRKNILRLIAAFEKLTRTYQGEKTLLVLAGKNGWLTDEIERTIAQSSAREQIILTGFVDAKQKAALLSKALATCNLGIYEGFGIPVLESLYYQTIPIFVHNTAMSEAAGQAGIGVNPFSISEITQAMKKVCHLNSKEQNNFKLQAKKQVEKFSYQKTANHILTQLYKLAQIS